nr:MAG: putative RNA-dependent RNA polymerase [Magoulivirus sp.]
MLVDRRDSPALSVAVRRALSCLDEVAVVLESVAGVSPGQLVVPRNFRESPNLPEIKQFCVGLLENPSHHVWWPVVRKLSVRTRVSIAGSLFLARKVLPALPSSPEDHARRLTQPPIGLPKGYLSFVSREVKRILGKGWDRGYESRVLSFTPPLSSTSSTRRASGGARAEWLGRRPAFLKQCLGVDPIPEARDPFRVSFMNVELDGKSRSVTVAPGYQHLLGPAHRVLYDALSREKWLLRGEATPSKLSRIVHGTGVYVSGDYEAATDNLPHSVARCILRAARSLSRSIPRDVWDLAESSLDATITYPDGTDVAMTCGQLMGNLFSFPLLCLQNYIAFRYFTRDEGIPVLINGDDIVFRAPREVSNRWMQGVGSLGLRLSPGKTLVSESFFSLNSAFFFATGSKARRIPVLRPALLCRENPAPSGLGGGCRTFARGFRGEAKIRADTLYLRWRSREFAALGRSVLRDLHAGVEPEALVRAGVAKREAFYLSVGLPNPLPLDQVRLGRSTVPDGWVRVSRPRGSRKERRQERAVESVLLARLSDLAWVEKPTSLRALGSQTWRAAVAGSHASSFRWWLGHRNNWKRRRGLFRAVAKRFRSDLSLLWSWRAGEKERKVWEYRGLARDSRPVRFVSAGCGAGPAGA